MKKLIAVCLFVPALCFAESRYIAAQPMDQPEGSTCKVLVSDYRPGSGVMYLGNCGWTGLKGVAAYVQGWNQGNQIRVVRGEFSSGDPQSFVKVTRINKVKGTITTYEQNDYSKRDVQNYKLDDILADAKQSGLMLDSSIMAYVKLANYIDVFE